MEQYSITISETDNSITGNLQEFIVWMQYQGWSTRTIETYSNNIQQFTEFLKNETETQSVEDINPNNLFKYQHFVHNRRLKSGKSISISSIHTKLVSIRSFLQFLYMNRKINFKPDLIIRLPVKRQPLPKNILSEKQIERLLSEPDVSKLLGLRNKAIIELLYASGIRNMELRNLTINDINLDQMQITIRRGKNRKDRVIPMGEIAADWIDKYINSARYQLFSSSSENILFLSKSGKKITRANLIWIISKYSHRAGLAVPVTPHTLRHTCATHMLKNGADIRYIQEILGHASVATTQIYTRVIITDLQRVFRETHPRAVKKGYLVPHV
jgi:integrase/recombinase XerD